MIKFFLISNLYFPGGIDNFQLKLWFDSRNFTSYPKNGNIWYDLSSNSNNGIIRSGITFINHDNNSYFNFLGNGQVVIPSLLSTYPVSALTSISHNYNWEIYGSDSQNQVLALVMNNKRISLSVNHKSSGHGLYIMYGGTNHHRLNYNIIKKSPSDWHNIGWRIYGDNNHLINFNEEKLNNFNLGGAHGGYAGWAIGGNSEANNWDEFWRGGISEIIIYNRILLDTEYKILNSYLNLKSNSYLNSNIFNINKSKDCIHQLIGIGRENENDYILFTNYSSGGIFLKSNLTTFLNTNNNYLLISHNNESLNLISLNYNYLCFNRTWYITKTSLNENYFELIFDFKNYTENLLIILSSNNNFHEIFEIQNSNYFKDEKFYFNINSY